MKINYFSAPGVQNQKITPEVIIDTCCYYFNFENKELLYIKTKKVEIIQVLQVIWYFLHKFMPEISLRKLAEMFGRKSHGTVINGIKQVNNYYATDKNFRQIIDKIDNELKKNY